ncbi:YdaS family helix-turn-helix protein [Massilia aerilata]|uniref:YdaS family helix-turn-helix protein n=1 Tax=Massilia aerilata TaxID=453817 RepID=A0ABW0S716_9BURK
MDKLLAFLNKLDKSERAEFCAACETTESYLRKAVSVNQRLGENLCINIDKASCGAVRCEDLRPDVDWAYLRGTAKDQQAGGATGEPDDA